MEPMVPNPQHNRQGSIARAPITGSCTNIDKPVIPGLHAEKDSDVSCCRKPYYKENPLLGSPLKGALLQNPIVPLEVFAPSAGLEVNRYPL